MSTNLPGPGDPPAAVPSRSGYIPPKPGEAAAPLPQPHPWENKPTRSAAADGASPPGAAPRSASIPPKPSGRAAGVNGSGTETGRRPWERPPRTNASKREPPWARHPSRSKQSVPATPPGETASPAVDSYRFTPQPLDSSSWAKSTNGDASEQQLEQASEANPGDGKPSHSGVIAAVGLTAAVAVAGGVFFAVQPYESAPLPTDITETTEASPTQLLIGHCLKSLPSTGSVEAVTVVPCSTRHRAEVIGFSGIAPANPQNAQSVVATQCRRQSTEFEMASSLSIPLKSRFFLPATPSPQQRATCLIESPKATLTGSFVKKNVAITS